MYQKQTQSKYIQTLTQYLKYFKQSLTSIVSLIQYHIQSKLSSSIHLVHLGNIDNLTEKIIHQHQKICINFALSPFKIKFKNDMKLSIDRFYFKLTQFVEFKFAKIKRFELNANGDKIEKNQKNEANNNNNKDIVFIGQFIDGFLKAINALIGKIYYINSQNINENIKKQKHSEIKEKQYLNNITNLGQLFQKIQQYKLSLIKSIFQNLIKIQQKNILEIQSLKFSLKIIEQNIFKPFLLILCSLNEELMMDHNQQLNFGSPYVSKKSSFSIDDMFNIKTIQSSKTQLSINNLLTFNSKHLKQQKQMYSHNKKFPINQNHNDSSQKQHPSLKKQIYKSLNSINYSNSKIGQSLNVRQKRYLYQKMLDILDIQGLEIYSKQFIMNQLKSKNQKNKKIIQKYVKSYKQKQKKYFKRLQKQTIIQIQSNKNSQQSIIQSKTKIKIPQYNNNSASTLKKHNQQKEIICKSQMNIFKKQKQNVYDKLSKRQGISSFQKLKYHQFAKIQLYDQVYEKNQQDQQEKPQRNIFINTQPQPQSEKSNYSKPNSSLLKPQRNKQIVYNQLQMLQNSKDTFAFKQKQKLYFQSLKNKIAISNYKTIVSQIGQLKAKGGIHSYASFHNNNLNNQGGFEKVYPSQLSQIAKQNYAKLKRNSRSIENQYISINKKFSLYQKTRNQSNLSHKQQNQENLRKLQLENKLSKKVKISKLAKLLDNNLKNQRMSQLNQIQQALNKYGDQMFNKIENNIQNKNIPKQSMQLNVLVLPRIPILQRNS